MNTKGRCRTERAEEELMGASSSPIPAIGMGGSLHTDYENVLKSSALKTQLDATTSAPALTRDNNEQAEEESMGASCCTRPASGMSSLSTRSLECSIDDEDLPALGRPEDSEDEGDHEQAYEHTHERCATLERTLLLPVRRCTRFCRPQLVGYCQK